MPSQSCVTRLHWILMRLHTFWIRSGSKPASLPPGSVMFQGSYAPSVAIVTVFHSFAWAVAPPSATTATAAVAMRRARIFDLFVMDEVSSRWGKESYRNVSLSCIDKHEVNKNIAQAFLQRFSERGQIAG